MPMKIKVTDYSPEFVKYARRGFKSKMFKHVIGTLDQLAYAYQRLWRAYASGEQTVPGSKTLHSSGRYTRSIQIDASKPFVRIIYTDYPPHKYIEEGHREIDLKPGLLHGPQARMGKHGPYNIVSFRHYTRPDIPGVGEPRGYVPKRSDVMPMNIQRMMQQATDNADREYEAGMRPTPGLSRKITSGPRPEDRTYQWGARLSRKLQQGRVIRPGGEYSWKTGRYAGMVRFNVPSGPNEKRTEYITFRVVSWKSDPRSWIVPPAAPIPIRQATDDFVNRTIDIPQAISDAIMQDII